MCGIGALFFTGNRDDNHAVANKMLTALRHRGPDSDGLLKIAQPDNAELILLHTRLAIRDLSAAGNQPMIDPRTGNGIVFNGEIYNIDELKEKLRDTGDEALFLSTTDTEILLHCYSRWGCAVFEKLDGMFAAIIFDAKRRRLIVARDHVGIKPLYYCRTSEGKLMIASEVRALIATGRVHRTINLRAVHDCLSFGAVQEPDTIFSAIRAFPPGHYWEMTIDSNDNGHCQRYWTPQTVSHDRNDILVKHRELLAETLREQLAADVTVGLFLSAGIDSSALAALVKYSLRSMDVGTYTIAGEGSSDEAQIAAQTAAKLGLQHSVINLESQGRCGWLMDGLDSMDQPSSDGINTYLISRAAREYGNIVTISGLGGDELHGGYDHYYSILELLKEGTACSQEKLKNLLGQACSPERLALLRNALPNVSSLLREKRRLSTPSWLSKHAPHVTCEHSQAIPENCIEPGTKLIHAEMSGYLLNTLLRDSDWASMANAQELRVPLLGRKYIEFMLSIPWEQKMRRDGINKPLLANLIPPECDEIIRRPKTGFSLDHLGMVLGRQQQMAEAIETLNDLGFRLNASALLESAKTAAGSREREPRRLWTLFALGRYFQQHI